MNNKKLNLKNDIVFKAFFSKKGNEEFLIDFLEALLKIKITKIEIQEDVNLEQLSVEEKGGRLDIQAILNDGVIANIEMQVRNNHNMEVRTTFYASKIMSRETSRGEDYRSIKKIILINILGYNMFKKYDEYIHKTAIVLDGHREEIVIDNIEWWFIELPKFRKMHKNINSKIDQWLLFIDDEEKELVKMAEEKNQTLQKAREKMNYLTGDAAVRRLAELREIWELDYNSDINYAREKGEKSGLKRGRKEGRAEGRAEGKKEEKKEIAKKLLKLQMPIEQISEITSLTGDEIKNIDID